MGSVLKLPLRQRTAAELPGLVGTARVDRRTRALLPRLRPGDVAVIDQVDLDRATARALVDAGVVAVVNASPMISGRYPNRGPEVLLAAGVLVVDSVGPTGLAAVPDGRTVRVDGGTVHPATAEAGAMPLAEGRELTAELVEQELDRARRGLATQLETFTYAAAELVRREQDLLLHGEGLPRLVTRTVGRPVAVVVPGPDVDRELDLVRRFLREQDAVLVGVGAGAELLRTAGLRVDVVVLDGSTGVAELPSATTLKAARDVVVRVDRGAARAPLDQLERLGVRPLAVESAATPEDVALVLADVGDASVIVGVGLHATLVDFLDRQRAGLASTYLARLKVGARLVDATSVPVLYAGRVRPWHLLLVLVAGLVALAAAIAVTPVGQEWTDQLTSWLSDTTRGLLP